MIISPYGNVLGELDEKEGLLMADINIPEADQMRISIPTYDQKRSDSYVLGSIHESTRKCMK
jgi:predicted amidohydrolase